MFSVSCDPDLGTVGNGTGNDYADTANHTYNASVSDYSDTDLPYDDMNITYVSSSEDVYQRIEEVLYSRVIIVICCIGVVGNLLNLLVLTRKSLQKSMGRMEKSSHNGLIALAVSDLLFCLACLPFVNPTLHRDFIYDGSVTFTLWYGTYHNAIINTFICSSTLLTVSMAIVRYLGICHPLKARIFVGNKLTILVIISVYLVSILANLPRFWRKKMFCSVASDGNRNYYMGKGTMEIERYKMDIYLYLYFVVCVALPFAALTFCTVFLIRALKESTRLRQACAGTPRESSDSLTRHLVTLTLSVIVVFNIAFVCPAEILNFFGEIIVSKAWLSRSYNLAVAVVNTLQALNFSLNFALYCAINAPFRRALFDLLCCRSCRKKMETSHAASTCITTVGNNRESATLLSRQERLSMYPQSAQNNHVVCGHTDTL